MLTRIVRIASAKGMNFSWNLNIFSGPKWTLTCGECFNTWMQRLPQTNYPTVGCPNCHTVNRIPVVYTSE